MTPPPIKPGKLFIISGPSQVGKDSIVRALWSERTLNFARIITNTTRAKRPGEKNGITYNFLSDSEFDDLIKRDGLIEWANVRNARFGTPKAAVLEALQRGHNVILQIDVQGAAQVKTKLPDTILIFVTAESAAEVKRRIMASSKMTPQQKADRWQEAQRELKEQPNYQYSVVNRFGHLDSTLAEVRRIIIKELSQARA